jgi:hypothetical protein
MYDQQHVQFDISANALEIRAVQSPKCIVWYAVDCTFFAELVSVAQAMKKWLKDYHFLAVQKNKWNKRFLSR